MFNSPARDGFFPPKFGWKKGPCGVNLDFFFSGKKVQHSPTPPRCTPGRDWSSNDVFIEIFYFPKLLMHGQFGPPPDLGNAPTGSKKVKSTPEHFLCCFFTPIRVATKCLGAQSAFWENRFFDLHTGTCGLWANSVKTTTNGRPLGRA